MTAISLIPGWTFTDLGSLGHWGSGGTPNRSTPAYYEGGDIPWLVIRDLNERVVMRAQSAITKLGLENSSAKLLPRGTLLVAMYGSIGKTSVTGIVCATNQAIAYCIPHPRVNLRYLHRAVQWVKPALIAQGQGGAQQNISQGILKAQTIPLAPEREQERIADKLDTVLTRVDAVNERLARVAPLLKRFRQSVLAAATSGRLTEDWRPLSRVGLDSWSRFPVSEMSEVVDPHPSHRTPPEVAGGVPYISIGDITASGEICLESARRVSPSVLSEHNQRYKISKGDFIFGKIGTLGKPAKLPVNVDYTISANVLLIQPKQRVVIPDFAFLLFSSPDFMQSVIEQSAATSQAAFGIKKMRGTEVGLPSLEEQTEIVRRVETLFAFADRLEARLQAAQTAADRLTPSLLAKAFRGELVPQDPNDEPAAELLKRLATTTPTVAKRTQRKKSTA